MGDLEKAREFFSNAARGEKRDASPFLNLAMVEQQLGESEAAASALTRALRIDPRNSRAAQRLAGLASRYAFEDTAGLDAIGLGNALRQDRLDWQPLAETALACLKRSADFVSAFETLKSGDPRKAAGLPLLTKTDKALQNPLLLTALARGKNTDPEWERLLTAMRRLILCEVEEERFQDRNLWAFACALLEQCINNEYVFAQGEAETAACASLDIDLDALLTGEHDQARNLLKRSLYEPLDSLLEGAKPEHLNRIRPRTLRDLVLSHMAARHTEHALADGIETVSPLADPTSLRVASQYEGSPYPRWRGIAVPESGSARRLLAQFAPEQSLSFLDGKFDVLIAGAGTGQHALRSAIAYGENARVLAIDISRASLAYAMRMAGDLGVSHVEFLQADILDMDKLPREFAIIECAGVLHHMADPLGAGDILAGKLSPGGFMYLGLYSAVSRRNLTALRDDPVFPGVGCSDAAARAFRHDLMTRAEGEAGHELLASGDFYALSDFRDLTLHESEAQLTIPEIGEFLARNSLEFRGFMLAPEQQTAFAAAFPGDPFPGTLANWWIFEQDNPSLFDAMYQFWCQRAA